MSAATPQFTGRHATVIIFVFFAVVVAVNLFMARMASSTFGGVVVENSYVASQRYNGWLDQAREEAALGWSVAAARQADGKVTLVLAGAGEVMPQITAMARHPLGQMPDQTLSFRRLADGGQYISTEPLAAGRWRIRVEAVAGGQRWRKELEVQ